MQWIEPKIRLCLGFLSNHQKVFQSSCTICIPISNKWTRVPAAPRPQQHLMSVFHVLPILVGVWWCLAAVGICSPPLTWCGASFRMRICHLRIFFGEVSVQVFGLVFKWVVCSIIECEEFFVYSGHQSFTWSVFCEDFLPVCGLSSVERKSFMLMKTSSSIFPFTNCAFGVVPKKSLPCPRSSRFSPVLPRSFTVLPFTHMFYNPFWVNFCEGHMIFVLIH